MGPETLRQHIAYGGEQLTVEFKHPADTSAPFFQKVVKGMLAMANIPDGGHVVIGVQENHDNTFSPIGLEQTQLAAWKDRDTVRDRVATYADPSLEFDIHEVSLDSKTMIVVSVETFRETPVICRKTYTDNANKKCILREGALYVRPRRKPESIEISTSADMRDLIELATTRRLVAVRRYAAMVNGVDSAIRTEKELDEARFNKEIEAFQ